MACIIDSASVLTFNDIAQMQNVDYSTVYRMRNKLHAYRFGGAWRVREKDYIRYLAEQRDAALEEAAVTERPAMTPKIRKKASAPGERYIPGKKYAV